MIVFVMAVLEAQQLRDEKQTNARHELVTFHLLCFLSKT